MLRNVRDFWVDVDGRKVVGTGPKTKGDELCVTFAIRNQGRVEADVIRVRGTSYLDEEGRRTVKYSVFGPKGDQRFCVIRSADPDDGA